MPKIKQKEKTPQNNLKYSLRPKIIKIDKNDLKEEKRFRINFSEEQIELLESVFSSSHYPDNITRKELAQKTGLSVDRITVWFQNRRAKFRKEYIKVIKIKIKNF
ncbi:Homeobox domain protein [Meloidogyne graminicola]|uniref:Homeobox domain protein n=1 Tax=Meloidogyne graminicola TaxID=189291 RepID=A0A8S9Z8G0_9BILA|nr:Homeobox domain protein [Meloidogyne graminicola]